MRPGRNWAMADCSRIIVSAISTSTLRPVISRSSTSGGKTLSSQFTPPSKTEMHPYIPTEAAFHLIAHTATGKIANDFAEKEQRRTEPINKIDMLVGGGGKTTFQFETQDGNVKIAEHNP